MFDRDPEFVRQFNEIIHDSQVKFIKLCSSFCVDKAGKHLENIEKIIDKYKNNYDMAIIYKDLEQKVTDNLKDKFTKSATYLEVTSTKLTFLLRILRHLEKD